ncbi:MAG: GNAT family N-acetyltransferase [Actinomycetota bacterium]|nr:GNAT family N-acetyltransferase [Actinomycetota bacterium]
MPFRLEILDTADEIGAPLRRALTDSWFEVANEGGAIGFAAPPVPAAAVEAAMERLLLTVRPGRTSLIVARDGDEVAGWVALVRNPNPLLAHWATVSRLQTRRLWRGQGLATELLDRLERMAHDDGLERLRLTARSGTGLDEFYAQRGWREVGRFPAALRVAPGDDRDEIIMAKELR